MDHQGRLKHTNQIDDYIFRSDELSNMCFYDFARCVRLITKSSQKNQHTSDERPGVMRRLDLKEDHPMHDTHVLLVHTDDVLHVGVKELVPKMIGTIPLRPSNPEYSLFVLAHFKPFSMSDPLLLEGMSADDTLKDFEPPDAVASQDIDNITSKFSRDDLRVDSIFPSPSDGVNSAIPEEDENDDDDDDGSDDGLVLRF
jgi:hypothetical protein